MKTFSFFVKDKSETKQLAQQMAGFIQAPCWVSLKGQLGAGKTTFTRYLLGAMGHEGNVKSPTYSLIECYDLTHQKFYHMDLYRVADAEELEYLGIRDYQQKDAIAFVEWAEKGAGFLPKFDISIEIKMNQLQRHFIVSALSEKGTKMVKKLALIK